MSNRLDTISSVSNEERKAVTAHLRAKGGVWVETPTDDTYMNYSRDDQHAKMEAVYQAVKSEVDVDAQQLELDYKRSQEFIDKAYDLYERRGTDILGYEVGRAFVVPMRSDRHNEEYASESTPFEPMLDPLKYGVESDIRMRTIYGLVPTVLDTYSASDNPAERGALVLAPMFTDMIPDINPNRHDQEQSMRLMKVGAHVLREVTEFAHKRIGADVLGLGAILPAPKLTNFGNVLHMFDGMENLVTTTGHGGTVQMIVETAKKVLEETSTEAHGRIGVIGGAGSIGYSSIATIMDSMEGFQIEAYDKREDDLHQMLMARDDRDKMHVARSALEVLRNNNLIVAAVTGTIDLDEEDPNHELDLRGKVIIDDSQPGYFERSQVEARGGKLLWVVGEDGSKSQFITRDAGYNYGDVSGLYGRGSEFACGQEAAVIAKYQAYEDAIRGPVNPAMVRKIGRWFREAHVQVAPFQSFGQPVQID